MAVIAWPGLKVASFRWKKMHRALAFSSIFGAQAIEVSGPLLEVEMTGVPQFWIEANQTVTFLESLNGYANQLELWNLPQPIPTGTMRGSMVLASNAAQGATSLQISAGAGEAGKTLLRGDLLGIGSGLTQQVVRVTSDATANGSGVITVQIGTPLRNGFSSGQAVTWDKPKALFRQKNLNEGIEYVPVIGQPWTLSLIESYIP